jgi:KaiC/GvpD/RAD55 family RecA-like ATPase
LSKTQFDTLFSNVENKNILDQMEFINPCEDISLPQNNEREISGKKLATAILSAPECSLEEKSRPTGETETASSKQKIGYEDDDDVVGSTSKLVRLIIDSMTHTQLLLGERVLIEFVMDFTHILKRSLNVTAILTLTTSSVDQRMVSNLRSIVDGIIEMRLKEDSSDMTIRNIRVRHLKGVYYDPN